MAAGPIASHMRLGRLGVNAAVRAIAARRVCRCCGEKLKSILFRAARLSTLRSIRSAGRDPPNRRLVQHGDRLLERNYPASAKVDYRTFSARNCQLFPICHNYE